MAGEEKIVQDEKSPHAPSCSCSEGFLEIVLGSYTQRLDLHPQCRGRCLGRFELSLRDWTAGVPEDGDTSDPG